MTTRARNACHNRAPFADTLIVRVGWNYCRDGFGTPVRGEQLAEIPNMMTKDCQYSIHTVDPKCAGCQWNQQETKENA